MPDKKFKLTTLSAAVLLASMPIQLLAQDDDEADDNTSPEDRAMASFAAAVSLFRKQNRCGSHGHELLPGI